MTFNPEIHRRQSYRLKGWDYSQPGLYFVTICVKDRKCLFGDIVDGRMVLSNEGKIIEEEWLNTEEVRKNFKLDEWVIMPNHVHGIIVIKSMDDMARACVGTTRRVVCVGTTRRVVPTEHPKRPNGPGKGSIGAMIGQFKSIASKRINKFNNTPGQIIWQPKFHDHIIRNELSLNRIREYIINNPLNWDLDKKNPLVIQKTCTK